MGATVESTEFEVDVTIKAAIESERYDEIADRIAALTNGKSIPEGNRHRTATEFGKIGSTKKRRTHAIRSVLLFWGYVVW